MYAFQSNCAATRVARNATIATTNLPENAVVNISSALSQFNSEVWVTSIEIEGQSAF